MENLVKTLYDAETLFKYDKNLVGVEMLPLKSGKKGGGYAYTRQKQVYGIEGREFYDKGFMWYENGKFYRYLNSIPDSVGEPEND